MSYPITTGGFFMLPRKSVLKNLRTPPTTPSTCFFRRSMSVSLTGSSEVKTSPGTAPFSKNELRYCDTSRSATQAPVSCANGDKPTTSSFGLYWPLK